MVAVAAALAATLALGACSRPQSISPAGAPAYEVSLAPHGQGLAMAWHGGNLAHSAIFLRFIDAAGKPDGTSLQISDGRQDAYEPDLQPMGEEILLAWYEKDVGGHLAAHVALLDRAGSVRWQQVISAAGREGRNPLVRVAGDRIMVAWLESGIGAPPAVWTAAYDVGGHRIGEPRRAAAASIDTWNLNGAVAEDGSLCVVYDARVNSRAKELQLVRITPTAIDARALTADDGQSSVYPDLALSGDRAALTWFDYRDGNAEVYVATGTLAAWLAGTAPAALRVTHTPAASIGAYAAWNGSQLGVAWSEQTANGYDIRLQRFNADGHPSDDARTLSLGDTQSFIPAIRAWHRGFVLAWNDYRPGAPADAHGGNAAGSSSNAMLLQVD
jgi:hypothetical protein